MSNNNQLAVMSQRLNIDVAELDNILMGTIIPDPKKNGVTPEHIASFLAVANEYRMNPLLKEIYAFPAKGGGIQSVIGIDGWIKIANNHPQYNGHDVEFSDRMITINKKEMPEYCKVSLHRKDREHPVVVIEYMDECYRGTDPWNQKPRRMLQHKAVIQAIRYAFGVSGVIDQDDAERAQERPQERDITPRETRTVDINDLPGHKPRRAIPAPPALVVDTETGEEVPVETAAATYCSRMEGSQTIDELATTYDTAKQILKGHNEWLQTIANVKDEQKARLTASN